VPTCLNHPSRSLSSGVSGCGRPALRRKLFDASRTELHPPAIRDGWPHAQDTAGFARIELYAGKEKRCVNNLEEPEADEGRVVAIQSLSNAELIAILQTHGDDDELTQMVEEELERRKTDGAQPQ
jgi:hypothetical protein